MQNSTKKTHLKYKNTKLESKTMEKRYTRKHEPK